MRGANNPPKKGRGPHAPAPLCSAPLAWSLPWCSAACPMLCINSDCVCPTPSRKPRPFSGGLTARKICGCGRARRARLRGLRCQRCAQTGDGAALRGALGLRGLLGNLGRSKSRRALWGALAALCAAVALRGRARPPPGTGVPVWRLRALRRAWATAAFPSAPCSLRRLSGAGRAAAIGTACVGGLRYSACHQSSIQSRKCGVSHQAKNFLDRPHCISLYETLMRKSQA